MRPGSGSLNRRIAIERATVVQDEDTGEEIKSWAVITPTPTIGASWRRASARETLAANEIGAIVTDVFEVRWTAAMRTVGPLDRVIYEGRIYDIADAVEAGFHESILITAAARRE